MNYRSFSFSLAILLAGCSTTYPLYIKDPKSDEIFIGTATSRAMGDSDFSITSAEGVVCTGTYKATLIINAQEGTSNAGTLTCSDGRKGTWVVSGAGVSGGQGVGTLDGKRIVIMYGSIARISSF